jgi:hypothetical protein
MYLSITVKMRIIRIPTIIAPHPALICSKRIVRQISRNTIRPKQTPDAEPPILWVKNPLSSEFRSPASA